MLMFVSVHVCVFVCICGLPEVSVLAVHGHTGTIWTWAAGESRKEEKTERQKGGNEENDIKEKVNGREEYWSIENIRGWD